MIPTTPSKNRQSTFCANSLISIANKSRARQALPSCTFLFCVGLSKSIACHFAFWKSSPHINDLVQAPGKMFSYWIYKMHSKKLFKIACLQCYAMFGQNPVLDISLCHVPLRDGTQVKDVGNIFPNSNSCSLKVIRARSVLPRCRTLQPISFSSFTPSLVLLSFLLCS